MRTALAIAITTLTLGINSPPMYGQILANGAPVLEKIDMVDAQSGWAIFNDYRLPTMGVLATTDGGTRWRDVTPPRSTGQRVAGLNVTVLSSIVAWVVRVLANDATFHYTSEILRTADGGRTWRSAAVPPPAGLPDIGGVSSISFINPREGWLLASLGAAAGSEEVAIYHSTDRGEKWIEVARSAPYSASSGLPFGGDKDAITFLNPTTGWITGLILTPDELMLYATHDGGRTWQRQPMPLPKGFAPHWTAYAKPPKFFTARDGILPVYYTVRDAGQETMIVAFYLTHDGGTTWTYALGPVSTWSVATHAVADMNHAWVRRGNVLYATTDGGRHWTTILRSSLLLDVAQLDFISPEVGWAVGAGARVGLDPPTSPFLLKTLDGGRTWSPVTYTFTR
jgi:photosystem II stability/assembly factor-like uncharacterized protein